MRMRTAGRPRIRIRYEVEALRVCVIQNGFEAALLLCGVGELAVAEVDGDRIPYADAGAVGL
jgi:hypothetical protein